MLPRNVARAHEPFPEQGAAAPMYKGEGPALTAFAASWAWDAFDALGSASAAGAPTAVSPCGTSSTETRRVRSRCE